MSLLAVKWLIDWQYLALTAARGAVSGPLWKPLWSLGLLAVMALPLPGRIDPGCFGSSGWQAILVHVSAKYV